MDAPVLVALCALLFTVGSFYWLQARKGRLKLYPVMTFGGRVTEENFALRVPIIIYNSGARPRVITAIRLRWQGDGNFLFECHTFRKALQAKRDDTEDYAHPYVISGRSVVTKYAHFVGDGFGEHLSDKPSTFDVEVILDDSMQWTVLGLVQIHTEIMYSTTYDIVYSNNPGVWPEGIMHRAGRRRAAIAEFVNQKVVTTGQAPQEV